MIYYDILGYTRYTWNMVLYVFVWYVEKFMHCLRQAIVPQATRLFCTIKNNLHHDGTGPIRFPFEDLRFCFTVNWKHVCYYTWGSVIYVIDVIVSLPIVSFFKHYFPIPLRLIIWSWSAWPPGLSLHPTAPVLLTPWGVSLLGHPNHLSHGPKEDKVHPEPTGSMVLLYMVTFTINIPQSC